MNALKKIWKTTFLGLAVVTLVSAAACGDNAKNDFLQDVVTREDYHSVYQAIGKDITVDMVTERNGLAYVTVGDKEYELGMDFLSMAMVYNALPAGKFDTAEKAYNEWWRLFMQRWNYLVPEAPLYSNQYYDVYNAKIDKLETNPYWNVAAAIVGAKVTSGENSVVLGSNTELTGLFRNAAFGKSAPGAADLAVQELTSGYSTVAIDKNGKYIWADKDVLLWHTQADNADGTKTFTFHIADDLTFSNGAPITAEN